MAWRGRVGRWSGALLRAVAMLPALAVAAAAVLDRGPGGSVRLSFFPVALAALDDHAWECARNSLIMASMVTLAARVVGVGLARIVVRWRFWGRLPLVALACAGVVVPPAFGAIGLRYGFGAGEAWAASAWSALGPWAGYTAWFWVALTAGAPLVGLATALALARVDPLWEDAARLAGASRRRVWRQVVWPVVRPEIAASLALVFTLTLIEPGAPLVLGLRRTLGFQIAEAALDPTVGQFTRAAVLTLAGVLMACLGRTWIGWWCGMKSPSASRYDQPSAPRTYVARSLRGGLLVLVLAVAALLAWVPLLGLATSSMNDGISTFANLFRDPLTRRYLINSAVLGLAVVTLDLVLARALAAWVVDRRGHRRAGRQTDWPELFPPLAIGVGFLALPWAIRMAADLVRASGRRSMGVEILEAVADALDPHRTPWAALIVAVGLARLPLLKRSAVERRLGLRPSRVEAAITLGASRRQSRRAISGRLLGVSPSAAFLTLVLAATSVTPALLLAPTAETRPVGPAVLTLIDEPGSGMERATALATLSVALNLAALAIAARGGYSLKN